MSEQIIQLIQEHTEFRIRDDSAFFEDKKGNLYVLNRAFGNHLNINRTLNDVWLKARVASGKLIVEQVKLTRPEVKALRRLRSTSDRHDDE